MQFKGFMAKITYLPVAGSNMGSVLAVFTLFGPRHVLLHRRLVLMPETLVGLPMHVPGPARERLGHVAASAQPNANFLRLPQRTEMPLLILGFVRQPLAFPANNAGSDGIEDSAAPVT